MATQGTPLRDVNVVGAPLQVVEAIPIGDLVDLERITRANISKVGPTNYANRFPTPPSAFGFLTEVTNEDGDVPYMIAGLSTPYILIGAVYPESRFLESTIGQIWPR